MRFRLRAPSGATHTVTLEDDATVNDFCSKITELSDLIVYDLKSGYPPKTLDVSRYASDVKLSSTDLKLNGEQIIVAAKDLPGVTFAKPTASHSSSMYNAPIKSPSPTRHLQSSQTSKPQKLPSLQKKANDVEADPPSVSIPSRGGSMVLRVMPDDNSCLFRSLSSCLLGNTLDGMTELRSIVAQVIQSDPETYTEVALERKPDDYAKWIQNPDSWGGYLDIKAISDYFHTGVVSIDVQSGLVTRYGEDSPHRCFIAFSGIHYDYLSFVPDGALLNDSEFDQKQFESVDDAFLEAAQKIGKILKDRKYYTDTAGFTIKCGDCGWIGTGEKSASKHAASTGHMNFQES